MKVILDTNILVYSAKQKVDLVSAIKQELGTTVTIVVPNLVLKELEILKEKAKKGSDKQAAKLALQIIKFSKLKQVRLEEGHTDKQILTWAKENKAIILTNDSEFRRKLKAEKIPTGFLRQGKFLVI